MLVIRLPGLIERRLDRLAKRTGRTKTHYAREALLRYLEDFEDASKAERSLERIRGGEERTAPADVKPGTQRGKTMHWNPAEFDYWRRKMPLNERKRQAWDDLRPDQRKAYTEWWTFGKFARVAPLDIDSRTIEGRPQPEPDILCRMDGEEHYFELGEVTDQGLAKKAGDAARKKEDTFAGPYSQLEPLERMLDQKCGKSYATNGLPVHLLLHYAVGHQVPNTPMLRMEIAKGRAAIAVKLQKSPFTSLWLFDGWEEAVIEYVSR